jgi:drug/metabolite transporter (DMT)-like permease
MHGRQLVDYVAIALMWGVSFILLLNVVRAFGLAGAVTFRALTASAILLALALASGRTLSFRRSWRRLAVLGATTVAGQLLALSFATPRIGTSMAAIFVGAIPLFSMLIGHAWGTERLTPTGRGGLVLGFGGMVLLVGFPTAHVTGEFVLGCLGSLTAAVCAAFGSNYARRYLWDVGSWEQTIGAFFFGGLMTLPLLLFVPVLVSPRLEDIGYLVLLAGMCSGVAYVLFFGLVAAVGPTASISVSFVVIVIAAVVGALVLQERLSGAQILGGCVIVTGCSLVLLPTRRRAKSTA